MHEGDLGQRRSGYRAEADQERQAHGTEKIAAYERDQPTHTLTIVRGGPDYRRTI